mmetsp:Transcript_62663/g.174642  ORF Transcript_62663/g.174642 Transcript_62663/m.174642 type:complete len:208 (+) Transcript_62663:148-771(+)
MIATCGGEQYFQKRGDNDKYVKVVPTQVGRAVEELWTRRKEPQDKLACKDERVNDAEHGEHHWCLLTRVLGCVLNLHTNENRIRHDCTSNKYFKTNRIDNPPSSLPHPSMVRRATSTVRFGRRGLSNHGLLMCDPLMDLGAVAGVAADRRPKPFLSGRRCRMSERPRPALGRAVIRPQRVHITTTHGRDTNPLKRLLGAIRLLRVII